MYEYIFHGKCLGGLSLLAEYGSGRPEPLKYDLAGKWSRRITEEHRLVYQVEEDNIIVYTCRYHY